MIRGVRKSCDILNSGLPKYSQDKIFVENLLKKYGSGKLNRFKIRRIAGDILEYNGLPRRAIKIKIFDFTKEDKDRFSRTSADYAWDVIKVSRSFLSKNTAEIIPVMAHEVFHLISALKVAKSIGVDNFISYIDKSCRRFFERNIRYVDSKHIDSCSYLYDLKLSDKANNTTKDGVYRTLWSNYCYGICKDENQAYRLENRYRAILGLPLHVGFYTHLRDLFPQVQSKALKMVHRDVKDKPFLQDAFFNSLWRTVEQENYAESALYRMKINKGMRTLADMQDYETKMLKLCQEKIDKNSDNTDFVNQTLIRWFNGKHLSNEFDSDFIQEYISYMDLKGRANQSLKAILYDILSRKTLFPRYSALYNNRLFCDLVERTGLKPSELAKILLENYSKNG